MPNRLIILSVVVGVVWLLAHPPPATADMATDRVESIYGPGSVLSEVDNDGWWEGETAVVYAMVESAPPMDQRFGFNTTEAIGSATWIFDPVEDSLFATVPVPHQPLVLILNDDDGNTWYSTSPGNHMRTFRMTTGDYHVVVWEYEYNPCPVCEPMLQVSGIAPIPCPSAVWLVLTGVGVVLGYRRLRRL